MGWIRQSKLKSLEDVLKYRNERVVLSFLRGSALSRERAERLFLETLKWLWLCRVHELEASRGAIDGIPHHLAIYPPMKLIDEMWHAFILCTAEYDEFCSRYLGSFIHHEPSVGENNDDLSSTLSEESDREALVRYICRRLGPEVLMSWFEEISQWQTSPQS